jgi:hypothetical protein
MVNPQHSPIARRNGIQKQMHSAVAASAENWIDFQGMVRKYQKRWGHPSRVEKSSIVLQRCVASKPSVKG